MSDQNRIKLAEAMGWTDIKKDSSINDCGKHTGLFGKHPDGKQDGYSNYLMPLPDPFTDANDDYQVLAWMRKQGGDYHFAIKFDPLNYRIGDYARAALKVIDDQH